MWEGDNVHKRNYNKTNLGTLAVELRVLLRHATRAPRSSTT